MPLPNTKATLLSLLDTEFDICSFCFCKYFIKKSINREVFKMFLDINYFEYLKLQWQLKYFLIQSKDIKIEVLKYIIISILAFIGGLFYFKNDVSIIENSTIKNLIKNKIPVAFISDEGFGVMKGIVPGLKNDCAIIGLSEKGFVQKKTTKTNKNRIEN